MDLARDTPVRLVPYPFARLNGALLLEVSDKEALVCLRRGARPQVLAELRRRLAQAYSQASQSPAYVADAIGQDMDLSRLVQEMPKIEDPLDSDNDAAVIRMINVLLTQALRQKASDIHIEPYDARSVVRFR